MNVCIGARTIFRILFAGKRRELVEIDPVDKSLKSLRIFIQEMLFTELAGEFSGFISEQRAEL